MSAVPPTAAFLRLIERSPCVTRTQVLQIQQGEVLGLAEAERFALAAELASTPLLCKPILQVEREAMREVLDRGASELAHSLVYRASLATSSEVLSQADPPLKLGFDLARQIAVYLAAIQCGRGSRAEVLWDLRRLTRIEFRDALVPGYRVTKRDRRRRRKDGIKIESYETALAPTSRDGADDLRPWRSEDEQLSSSRDELVSGDWVYDGSTRAKPRRRTTIVGGDASPVEAHIVAKLRVNDLSRRARAISVLHARLGWSLTKISRKAGMNDDWASTILSRYRKSNDRNRATYVRSLERGFIGASVLIQTALESQYRTPTTHSSARTSSFFFSRAHGVAPRGKANQSPLTAADVASSRGGPHAEQPHALVQARELQCLRRENGRRAAA
jgi:hypothetical protein